MVWLEIFGEANNLAYISC